VNVTLADVLAGAAAHAVPLTAECAGYLVLAAADQALLAPRRMPATELELCADGSVRAGHARACEESEAERDLRGLLDELLLAASSVTPALLRTGRRANGGSLSGLLREIETALIPVNRAAARRALARLSRETSRALESGRIRREMNAAAASALAARILTPAPRPATPPPPAVEIAFTPAPASVAPPPTTRSPSMLTVPNDPVPPPTPRPTAKLAAPARAVLPSLTPPPVAPTEVETRPEPVVLRASTRPPAPPRDVRPLTPLFGTVLAERSENPVAERRDTLPSAAPERRDTVPAPPAEQRDTLRVAAPTAAELEALEHTELKDDVELVYLDGEPETAHDLTEHCPPVSEDEDAALVVADAPAAAFESSHGADEDITDEDIADEDIAEDDGESADSAAAVTYGAADEDEAALAEALEPLPTPLILTERLALPIAPTFPTILAVLPEPEPLLIGHVVPVLYAEREPSPIAFTRLEPEPLEADAFVEPGFAGEDPEPPVIDEPEPSPIAELARLALAEAPIELPERPVEIEAELISEVEFAVLLDDRDEWPDYGAQAEPEPARTPPPRLALPKARPSDVDDLLGRLDEAPLAVDELRDGLQRLAGVDLTPPPRLRVPRID
jgi:hypothetical protein